MAKIDKMDQDLNEKMNAYGSNRRHFLRNSAGAGMGLFGSVLLGACGGDSDRANAQMASCERSPGVTDTQILNFALNLEYLEAEFYLLAATGQGLDDSLITGTGTPGMVTGGSAVPFVTSIFREYANEIAKDERDHVAFLRTALGASAVARPAINLTTAFDTVAAAAGIAGGFDPFGNENDFLLAAYIFEDVGVTAYKGAAPLVDSAVFLEAAAGLLAAEAYHAGLVRTVLYARGGMVPALRMSAGGISDARDSLDGPEDKDQGIAPMPITLNGDALTASNIVPLDANGLAFSRTTGEVLNIAYINPDAVTQGGFFPNGVNGVLNMSADNTP